LIKELFKIYEVDKNNLFILQDNNEKIKISNLREFLKKSFIKPS